MVNSDFLKILLQRYTSQCVKSARKREQKRRKKKKINIHTTRRNNSLCPLLYGNPIDRRPTTPAQRDFYAKISPRTPFASVELEKRRKTRFNLT
jgi:hypothetical protein